MFYWVTKKEIMIYEICAHFMQMTALILPGMLAKKKGFIINIASASGKNFVPFLTLYAATKVSNNKN